MFETQLKLRFQHSQGSTVFHRYANHWLSKMTQYIMHTLQKVSKAFLNFPPPNATSETRQCGLIKSSLLFPVDLLCSIGPAVLKVKCQDATFKQSTWSAFTTARLASDGQTCQSVAKQCLSRVPFGKALPNLRDRLAAVVQLQSRYTADSWQWQAVRNAQR